MAPPEPGALLPRRQETANTPLPEDAARDLSQAVGQMMRVTGNFLADTASIDHRIDPQVRRMMRDFGLVAQDGANALDPPPPPWPSSGFEQCSAVSKPRRQLQAAGVDPDNLNDIGIGVLDVHHGKEGHGAMVSGVIADPERGLIHGARLLPFEYDEGDGRDKPSRASQMLEKPGENDLGAVVSELATSSMDFMSQKIQASCIDNRDPKLRVLNVSLGTDQVSIAKNLYGAMVKDPEKFRPWLNKLIGEDAANKWIAGATADRDLGSIPEDKLLFQAIFNGIDKQLATDPKFQASMSKYREVTKQAAESGVTIVVAAGNEQDDLANLDLNLKPGQRYNFWAQSDHVIAVGACNLRQTPERNSDDCVTGFSSHGTQRYHPTVVAQGQEVSADTEGGIAGTSFASPLVSATVALMLAQNPKLKFDEIKAMLENNASRLRGASVEAQGAGEVNIDQAVLAARDSGKPEDKRGPAPLAILHTEVELVCTSDFTTDHLIPACKSLDFS